MTLAFLNIEINNPRRVVVVHSLAFSKGILLPIYKSTNICLKPTICQLSFLGIETFKDKLTLVTGEHIGFAGKKKKKKNGD